MKRRGKQTKNEDGKAEDSVQEDHSSSAENPAKKKRSASDTAKRIGGKVYKASGCAMPWWQCLLGWGALIALITAVRLVLRFLWHKTVAQYQQSCSVLLQAILARDKYSAKDWVRPGEVLRDEGLRPKHPVVVVPGESRHP